MDKKKTQEGWVEDLTHDGRGVVKKDHYPIFVAGAFPGEKIRYQLVKEGKKFATGSCLEILEASPHRIEKKNPDLDPIMPLQGLAYEEQKAFKENLVRQAFKRIGGFKDFELLPILGAENSWAYRNKMTLAVEEVQGQLEFGIYQKNTHNFIPIEKTYLAEDLLDEAIFKVRDLLRKHKIQAYEAASKRGDLHHIVLKRGHYQGELMVIFVTRKDKTLGSQDLYQDLAQALPDLKSLVQNVQEKVHQEILGKKTRILWGKDQIVDQMLGLDFIQSPQSFYQVNTPQAERLYEKALAWADLKGQELALDAYCGLGTLSLNLAKKAKKVYAMDIVKEAILAAKENQDRNQIANVHFEAGKAETILPKWENQGLHFDLGLVDPPRKGLDPRFIQSLLEITPGKIIYVSCNPATLTRDCKILGEGGYRLEKVQPIDMFPQTPHVESVVLMTRK